MNILWVGDAIVSTGFSKCTHSITDRLASYGCNVSILGLNYFGDPHDKPVDIYPCYNPIEGGRDFFGLGRIRDLTLRTDADVVVIQNDPWNIKPYLEALGTFEDLPKTSKPPAVLGYLAVDSRNQKGLELNELDGVVVWTDFAEDELRSSGYVGRTNVLPLSVDLESFKPRDKILSRQLIFKDKLPNPSESFVVGVIGRNQTRKRLDLTIEYFAAWLQDSTNSKDLNKDDAYLYLHVAPTGDTGFDLRSIINYYGISDRVIICEPDIGFGVSDDVMPMIYNCLDVYVSTSQAEGWGLPAMEAMASKVPCLVPVSGGLGSWASDAALTISCSSSALTAPERGLLHTVGSVPDKHDFVAKLNELYWDQVTRLSWALEGFNLVHEPRFNLDNIASEFFSILVDIEKSR
jgi:glycosyltransferase involved in cell wall biosynthesis